MPYTFITKLGYELFFNSDSKSNLIKMKVSLKIYNLS